MLCPIALWQWTRKRQRRSASMARWRGGGGRVDMLSRVGRARPGHAVETSPADHGRSPSMPGYTIKQAGRSGHGDGGNNLDQYSPLSQFFCYCYPVSSSLCSSSIPCQIHHPCSASGKFLLHTTSSHPRDPFDPFPS